MGERYKNIDIKIYSYDADGGHFDKIYSQEKQEILSGFRFRTIRTVFL